jgi:hypothetical protein
LGERFIIVSHLATPIVSSRPILMSSTLYGVQTRKNRPYWIYILADWQLFFPKILGRKLMQIVYLYATLKFELKIGVMIYVATLHRDKYCIDIG